MEWGRNRNGKRGRDEKIEWTERGNSIGVEQQEGVNQREETD